MNSVYLTYSGYNCEAVLQVMEALVRRGDRLMCECMLPYGCDLEKQAHKMISEADIVVAIITDDAMDCPEMARDLAWAREAERKLLTVAVENASLPMGVTHVCSVSAYPTEGEIQKFLQQLDALLL